MLAISDEGALVANLVVMLVFGGICAAIAAGRGRSAVGWFFIGMFAPCLGLILVLVLPDMKVQEDRERRRAQENRKLREQLSKERQVSDQRHQHVEARLGAHDEVLGLDTSAPPALPAASAQAQLTNGDQWFYARDGERQGPVSAETVRHLLQAKAIDGDSLIWSEGMQDWLPLRDVDGFRGDVS